MKLKLFVCAHKKFDLKYCNTSYMIPLYNSDCNNDMDSFSDKCLSEMYMIYDVYKNQDKYFDYDTQYVGFCHYRRYFNIDGDSIISKLSQNDRKVILLYPVGLTGSVINHYNYYHDRLNEDFFIIKNILKTYYPEYISFFDKFINNNYFTIATMFITHKDIFNEYCKWIFTIIKEYFKIRDIHNYEEMYKFVENHQMKFDPNKPIEYNCRHISFIAERLTSFYFIHNYYNNIEYTNLIFA